MRNVLPLYRLVVAALVALALESCFTGVESTSKITDKDVKQAFEQLERSKRTATLNVLVDSLPAWKQGKTFWVVDRQANMIFSPSPHFVIDSLELLGKPIVYQGYSTRRQIDNTEVVDLKFRFNNHELVYPTGRHLDDISHQGYTLPFLVDGDMINEFERQLLGKTVYIKTSTWYSLNEEIIEGRKFVPVVITAIKPGNRIYDLRVEFKATDDGSLAMLWMTGKSSAIAGRDFDSQFSLTDVRSLYPSISPETWQLVTKGKVAQGMTKDECRLSLGAPGNVVQRPDQAGLREYWYYDGGRYLFFVDGILKEYR